VDYGGGPDFYRFMEYARDGERARFSLLSAGLGFPQQSEERSLDYSPEDFRRFGNGLVYDRGRLLVYNVTEPNSMTAVGLASVSERSMDVLWLDKNFPGLLFCIARGAAVGDLLNSPSVVVGADPELLDGTPCFRVQATLPVNRVDYRVLGWLAVDRGCFPARMELWTTSGGSSAAGALAGRMVVTNFLQTPSGYWLPSQVVHTTYRRNQPGEGTPVQTFTYSILDVELEPRLPPTAFSTETDSLPQGVLVQDQVDEVEFTVGEGPVSETAIERTVDGAVKALRGEKRQ
jgi:hypothetical protein